MQRRSSLEEAIILGMRKEIRMTSSKMKGLSGDGCTAQKPEVPD